MNLLSLLSLTALSFADAQSPVPQDDVGDVGLRIGACAGFSPKCMMYNVQLDIATPHLGFSFGVAHLLKGVLCGSARYYITRPEGEPRFRPYVYGARVYEKGSLVVPIVGTDVGVGTDIHLLKSKRLIVQPSIGVSFWDNFLVDTTPSLAVSILYRL